MPRDDNAILVNLTTLDSGNDGNGSGSDPTAAPGCILSVEEEADIEIVLFCKASDTAGEPGDADTLDVAVGASVDGGTNYGVLADFRQILGSELPDDTAAGDKTLRLAIRCKLPRADSGQSNLVKIRPQTTASDASNWALYMDVRPLGGARAEWLAQAIQN